MKDKLLIIGAGGHGKVIADIALKMNNWNSIAFLDDDESTKSSMNIKVIGRSADAYKYVEDFDFFVGIGNNSTREVVTKKLKSLGATIPTLIHPTAVLGEKVELEDGIVLMANAVINCCTRIGEGCIINTAATIDHDNLIGDFVHISPGVHLAGSVKVGHRSWLGIGSIVSNNVVITSGCKIGAGAVVIKDITDSGTYVGVPVRRV